MRIIGAVYEGLISAMLGTGAVLVFFLMLLISGDIVGRTFLNYPIAGTPEMAKISLVAILFLGITKTLKMERHIRGSVLAGRLSLAHHCLLDILVNLFGLLLFVALCYSSWDLTWSAWSVGEYEGEGALRVPTYPLRMLILLSSVLMVFQFAVNVVHDFREIKRLRGK